MPRKSRPVPPYPDKPHRSGQARIHWKGRDIYLGRFGSPESRRKYASIVGQLAAGGEIESVAADPTVADVVAAWSQHAQVSYRPESREPTDIAGALAPALRMFGSIRAADFDARCLKSVRAAMVSSSWMTAAEKKIRAERGKQVEWSVSYVNHQTCRIKTVWRWAESEGLVSAGSWERLRSLRPLDGRDNVRRTSPRSPVEWERVEATLPRLSPVVRAMVLVQWWSGSRPGEVCRMRKDEVDTSRDIWFFRPTRHKSKWRGDDAVRAIPLEGQRALLPWLDAADGGYVFRPHKSRGEYYESGYGQAIARACEKAGVAPWTPYQLRHAFKLRITRQFGLDAARAAMGQSSLGSTNGYARQQDLETAARVAKEAG